MADRTATECGDDIMSPLMVDTTDHYRAASTAARYPDSCSNTQSSSRHHLSNNSSSALGTVSSRHSISHVSGPPSSQQSGLPSTRTSMLPSTNSQSSRTPSTVVNGHVGSIKSHQDSPKQKFTEGKGFLHYAQRIDHTDESDDDPHVRNNDDNISTTSSFKMDSDILSLENAQFAYSYQYSQQLENDEKFYEGNSIG